VNFTGRCPFNQVTELHQSALATVLLLPDAYARTGQPPRGRAAPDGGG
jgi:hypothetical protein